MRSLHPPSRCVDNDTCPLKPPSFPHCCMPAPPYIAHGGWVELQRTPRPAMQGPTPLYKRQKDLPLLIVRVEKAFAAES